MQGENIMNLEIMECAVSIISFVFSAIIAVLMYKISKNQTQFLEKTEINKNTPYLFPVKDSFEKNKWIRYYYGGVTLPDLIPSEAYHQLTESQKEFIDDCGRHKKEAYFYYLDKAVLLVLNGNSGMPSIIVEHNNAAITLKNFGALISKVHIDYVKIYFADGTEKHYKGVANNFYTDVILPNGEVTIVLDEVVNDIRDSSCQINRQIYESLDDYDLFHSSASISLKYDKYTIGLSVWNQYDEKFKFDIIIEKVGQQFQREVIKR